ncbi:hypothetical protein [uncultured Ruminococcus sp.]|uniref:InlB B-repeat-containing protein n=1 Tax=uncultured Ruminococcus sp. TaxID=165186 RepID=UPI0025ED493D|nr:hypothetical protein [uncultured Ruminococcus sp.]
MRHSIKRISKSALSVILALMMVVSTMVVGMVTVGAAVAFTNGEKIYLDTSKVSWWAPNSVTDMYLYGTNTTWVSMELVSGETTLYVGTIPTTGTYENVIFVRKGSHSSDWTKYNQTVDITDHGTGQNLYTFTDENTGTPKGSWSTYGGSSGGDTKTFYVAGTTALVNASNSWKPADDSDKMTKNDDGTYSITYTNLEPKSDDTYQFKITTGTWDTSYGFGNIGTTQNVTASDNGGNIKLTFNTKSDITITIDPNKSNKISIVATPVVSDYTLSSSVVGSGEVTFANASDSSTITTPAQLASGTSVIVNATPATGYQLDSIKLNDTTINNGATFAMPSQDSTVTVTFSLKTPTVTLTPDATTVNVGESVALTPSVAHDLTYTGEYTVTKDGNSVIASAYISDDTFTTPLSADSVGTYVVTYTATVTSGSDTKSASASSTITVKQSEEQQAYNTLVTWLADSSKNPDNITGKTTSSLNAYKTAYTAAQTAVSAGYPTSGTVNTTALSSLQSAYSALTDKTSLAKPELAALPQYIDLTSESKSVTLSVSNASSYPPEANFTYSFYQEGNDTALYTGTDSSCTVNVATEGTFNYYVKVNLGNTDDYTSASDTSETKSVIAVTPVTVSVLAGANGRAYVSSYTTYDNLIKSNTDTALTSVKVYPGSSVTFTAVPGEGYVVDVWNTDQSSGSTTYTVSKVTAATNVTVSFTGKPKFSYALVGASTIKNSNGQAAAWNGSETLDQAAFDTASSLKFTNNKLVVTAEKDNQFRFIGTDGTNYYHYGSASTDITKLTEVDYTTTYTTTQGDKLVYKFKEAGTFEIAITSGTDSPMSFKVTKLASYYVVGRFAIKNSDGTYTSTTSTSLSNKPTDNFWNVNNKNISFSYDSGSIYKLNTGLTVNELTVSGNPWYFRIYDGTDTYYRPSFDTALKASDAKSKYNTDTSTDKNFYFNDSDESGIVILCFDASTKQFYFEIETGKTPLDAPTIASDRASLTAKNPTATITVTPATYPEGVDVEYYLYNGGTYVATTTGTTFTVSSAGTYTVKAYPSADNAEYKESVASNSVTIVDGRTPVAVKAMNGIKNGDVYTGTTTAEAANTSSSVVWNESSDLSGGKEYTVTKGSTVKVTTTMVADTTTAEKFVYAYVVNNKDTYLATEGIAVTGAEDKKYATYSATFTISEDATDTTFTVVPIYYYKACAKDGEYIKFYVDKSDTTSWGNNLYNYAYYYKTAGDTEDVYRSDGTWPGQPMLYDATKQLYYSLVPKQIGGKLVSGLTVNIGSDKLQSFDFDDFKVINEIGYDIVRLDLKQRSGHSSNKDKLVVSYDDTNNVFNDLTYNPANLVSDFSGRWEAYKDINGNDVSLLGKAVNTDNTNTTYIVSSATHTSGERGQWMSAFSVYKVANDGTVTYVTTAFPSDFIPRIVKDGQTEATANTSAYNAILNAGLGDAPVKIVYEDQVSTRIDGRWYYAQSDSEVSAYAYYRTTDNGTTYSELKQDAAYASVNGAVSVTNPKLGLEISVVSSPLAGYIFDHWSVADKDGNIIINKLDNVGSAFTTTLDQEMHYVANFRKATSGQLVINHSKYTGSDAKNGLGYYRLEVQVKKSDGTWSTVYAGSGTGANGQSVTIADLVETDQIIRIKLITETAGENTFRYWYTTSSDGTEIIEDPDGDMTWNGTATSEPTGKNGILTYTFDTEVWKLFSGGVQKVTQLNFYSDIAPMNKNYKLTYKYTDRFGKEKIYVVKGTHDDAYYVKNNNSWAPSDELITKNAPPIDDLYKNCTWIIANSNKDGTDATLVAVQNGKTYKVDIYNASGASESYTLPINSYVKNSAGEFFVADEYIMDGETKKYFSYWAVYKRVVKDGKVTRGEEVARHFYREYTLVVLDDYWIEPVYGAERNDQVYISAPQYTREKYSNEDGTVVKDSLYVDFMVAYMSAAGDLIRNDVSGDKYQTGLIIEIGQNKVLGTNEDSSVNTDYSGITYDSNLDTVKSAANNLTGSPTKYSFATGDNRKLYNFRATNTNYNNMNRLDYAVPFTNTENNRMYVMKAYYYVIIDSEIVLSNPVYFNLYEIGTSDPITE